MSNKKLILKNKDGIEFEASVRKALPVTADRVRYQGFKQEKLILKKDTIRIKGHSPLACDILFERDVPIKLRDGITIYTDIFRPNDGKEHPAIIAFSPYGKEIGGQWLDDVPLRAKVSKKLTSGLEKFEAPDPSYWVEKGYCIINPDLRGAYNSEGIILFFGSGYGRDGYDIIEWAAEQSWCNGKIGMSGNSWLAISQWFIAAEKPPHLSAIAPWEGLADCYREVATQGGVPMPEFVKLLTDTFSSTENGGVEDPIETMIKNPIMNAIWEDKIANLEAIDVPAYIVASYNNPIHTNGTFDGFLKISSKEKWLRIHNSGEWDDYYKKENVEDLRKFFDKYLKGINNNWDKTPKIRMSVLNPGGKDIINRVEEEFPLKRTEYKKLYLNAQDKGLYNNPIKTENFHKYDSDSKKPFVNFKMKMEEKTEITGYMKLRLWVKAQSHDDMDLEIRVQKLNKFGMKYIGFPMQEPVAKGHMRVSLRELDEIKSTEYKPYQTMKNIQKLKKDEIVPIDIAIWPMGMIFNKNEYLQVTVSAFKSPKEGKDSFGFGTAKITIPKEGYTYFPNEKVEMITIGGNAKEVTEDSKKEILPKDINKGEHIIYTGGEYDSYLYVPIIPNK